MGTSVTVVVACGAQIVYPPALEYVVPFEHQTASGYLGVVLHSLVC